MYWQRRYVVKQYALPSNAATERITLPRTNVLSALEVRLAWQMDTAGGGGEDIFDAVDKVEVIANGSEVLFSMPGNVLMRLGHLLTGKPLPARRDDRPGVVQFAVLPIFFGRGYADPAYNLDLSKFTDVELRVQYSPTIDAAGHTGFLSGAGVLDVIGWFSMEGAPAGATGSYIRRTVTRSFTSAASGVEEVDLPRRFPIRAVYVYCYEAGVNPSANIPELQVDLNNGARIPLVARWDDLEEENAVLYGVDPTQVVVGLRADGGVIETKLGRIKEAQVTLLQDNAAGNDFPIYDVAAIAGGQVTLSGILVEGSGTWAATTLDTTKRPVMVLAKGHSVGNLVAIPFALPGQEEMALAAPEFGSVKLLLTQGDAGADVQVITEEVVKLA